MPFTNSFLNNSGKYVQELARDFRKVMEPYTASKIKVLNA